MAWLPFQKFKICTPQGKILATPLNLGNRLLKSTIELVNVAQQHRLVETVHVDDSTMAVMYVMYAMAPKDL